MRLKELSVELRDKIVSRHRSGEGYNNISVAFKVPKEAVASIIPKWKPSLQHSTNQALTVEWLDGSQSSVKST